ncbi:13219_t:CDS:2, partial [Racocetra persica]
WKLTLVLCSVFPLMAAAGGLLAKNLSQDTTEAAGGVAEQVLSGIRTIVAFGGQKLELERYTTQLDRAYIVGRTKSIISGLGLGVLTFIMFGCYGLAFWYGSILIVNGEMTVFNTEKVKEYLVLLVAALSNASCTNCSDSVSRAE